MWWIKFATDWMEGWKNHKPLRRHEQRSEHNYRHETRKIYGCWRRQIDLLRWKEEGQKKRRDRVRPAPPRMLCEICSLTGWCKEKGGKDGRVGEQVEACEVRGRLIREVNVVGRRRDSVSSLLGPAQFCGFTAEFYCFNSPRNWSFTLSLSHLSSPLLLLSLPFFPCPCPLTILSLNLNLFPPPDPQYFLLPSPV